MLDKAYIMNLIDCHKVISFDIFDTLLLRPFMYPTDLFQYMENLYDIRDFALKRCQVENQIRVIKNVRKKAYEDVTIDEIYERLPKEFLAYKEKELLLEEQLLQPNHEVVELFNYAKEKNKTVIISSDMYIGTTVLANILKKKGITDFDKIYVSCDIKKTKACGMLYDYILEDLRIKPQEMLHIGDNMESDIEKAASRNIDTFFYEIKRSQFIKVQDNKKLATFYTANKNLTLSIILGLKLLAWGNNDKRDNYYYKLGYEYGGILALEFTKAVLKVAQCRHLTDIFFAARDGYILNNIFNIIAKNAGIKSHYVYASRKLRSLCLENEKTYDSVSDKEYGNYIKSLQLNGNRIGIVDSCALFSFSAQNLVKKYLSDKYLLGIYLICNLNYSLDYINLSNVDTTVTDKMFNWNFIELLFSSKENPIIGIKDLKPVFLEDNEYEFARREIVEQVIRGEMNYVKDFLNVFGVDSPNLNIKNIFEYIGNFWQNMDENDINKLLEIKHAGDEGHKKYSSLISDKDSAHV